MSLAGFVLPFIIFYLSYVLLTMYFQTMKTILSEFDLKKDVYFALRDKTDVVLTSQVMQTFILFSNCFLKYIFLFHKSNLRYYDY